MREFEERDDFADFAPALRRLEAPRAEPERVPLLFAPVRLRDCEPLPAEARERPTLFEREPPELRLDAVFDALRLDVEREPELLVPELRELELRAPDPELRELEVRFAPVRELERPPDDPERRDAPPERDPPRELPEPLERDELPRSRDLPFPAALAVSRDTSLLKLLF